MTDGRCLCAPSITAKVPMRNTEKESEDGGRE